MNAELQQLKDIHLPTAISTWPSAPGWIAFFLLALTSIFCIIYTWRKNKQKYSKIKYALAKLDKLQQLCNDNSNDINIAAEISTLLRRTALYYFPRQDVAGLSGKDWLEFIDQSNNNAHLSLDIGDLLTDAPYRQVNNNNLLPLFTLARTWLNSIPKKNMSVRK